MLFKMIEGFSFNLDKDCYAKENGLEMKITNPDKGLYVAKISYNGEMIISIPISSASYDDCEKELEKLFSSKNSPIVSIEKKLATKTLPLMTKEEINDCINKSNAAEVSFLEKRVESLEGRVKILEDSVEDLETWRRS